jgi:hypothetical protein
MNKYETGERLKPLKKEGIYTAPRKLEKLQKFKNYKILDYKVYWKALTKDLISKSIIVKPVGDGCSAGIARLYSAKDLTVYLKHVQAGSHFIPDGSLKNQHGIIEMPLKKMKQVLFERFIVTDSVRVIGSKLRWKTVSDWIEITMGVIQERGKMKAMSPSLTVALGNILTLEEKFQGGTGVNITPPPREFVKPLAIKKAKARMEIVAKTLGIQGYARIDAFMHIKTGELIIIEANTTPGLTASTVIYHQALEETPSMNPTQFLEQVIGNGLKNSLRTK